MGVLARNYEKIYFRENVVETKNLPPYFPISLVRTKKKNQFFGPQKKTDRELFPKVHTAQVGTCSRLCAESQKVLSRHFRENTIHVQYGGTSRYCFFFLDFSMVNHQHQSQGITGKPIPFFFFWPVFFYNGSKTVFYPFFSIFWY